MAEPTPEPSPADVRSVDNAYAAHSAWAGWAHEARTSTGGFVLDVDAARECQTQLQEVAEAVAAADAHLWQLLALPPAGDDVTINALRQRWHMVEDARTYLARWRQRLIEAQAALGEEIASYSNVDSAHKACA